MALPNTNITVGAPPLLWSDVHEAFRQVNENFDSVAAALGVAGLTPIDFETLDTSLKPTTDNTYSLGDITHKWTSVYTGEYTTVYPLNGLWAGNAQIKGIGLTVNLPADSTIGGDPLTGIGTSLIIDPDKTFFKSVQVDNGNQVVANNFADTLNLNSGTAVQLVVDSGAESITINNTGVTQLTAGSGASVSAATGNITVTNTGVRSLTSTTSLPSGRTAGAGINIDHSTGDGIKITNTGVISITSGVGITVAADSATGEVQIINSAPAGSAFAYVEVNGDSGDRISADLVGDVLNINSGTGITLTKNTTTDTLTITVNPVFDLTGDVLGNLTGDVLGNLTGDVLGNLTGNVTGDVTGNTTGYHSGDVKGSVVADDSTILVDGVSGRIVGPVYTGTLRTSETKITLGALAGNTNQADETISIGWTAGYSDQGYRAVAIGRGAGGVSQGIGGVGIGNDAGSVNQGGAAIAIGYNSGQGSQGTGAIGLGFSAGLISQGDYAIAIGYSAGWSNQAANSIILSASGSILDAAAAGFYVDPIRSTANGTPLMYNSTTKELFYSTVLEFVGSTISTSDSSGLIVDVQTTFNTDVIVDNDIQLSNIDASIRGTNKIKFVPSNADELSDNVRLEITSDNTIEPRLSLDTPSGVDLTLSSGLAGIVISKINERVNLAAGNNAFIVRSNGSWWMTPLDAAPVSPSVGMYIANGTTWDPATKATGKPYPVFYDGTAYNALY